MARRKVDPLLASVSEAVWQAQIVEYATLLGGLVAHVGQGRVAKDRWVTPTTRGFPDLLILFDGALVVFECKSEKAPPSAVTAEQQAWVDRFASVPGVVARVVRPSDWSEVEQILRTAARK